MAAGWKIAAEAALMAADSPSVLTTAMLMVVARQPGVPAPSRATFHRWLLDMAAVGKLRPVTKGVWLNRLGHRDVGHAAAAHWLRHGSVVSLSWVLEQAGVTNNVGDTVTCVVPLHPGAPNPQLSTRETAAGSFRFFAMPAVLVDGRSGDERDIRDPRFDYPRATPEKAFLDWVHLGASPRSRLPPPPLDLAYDELDPRRLRRLSRAMGLDAAWQAWLQDWQRYQSDEGVVENSPSLARRG